MSGMTASLDFDPFDRMLLTADGTVTSLLEACAGEPITTRTTRQAGPATLELLLATTGGWWHPDTGLVELAPAEQLIACRASLCGACSGAASVLAESLVVPTVCPAWMPSASCSREPRWGACWPPTGWRRIARSCRSPPRGRVQPPIISVLGRARRWRRVASP